MMRFRAGLRPSLTLLECKAAHHAARQARGGSGLAFRPAFSALRCEAAAQAAYRCVMRLRAGHPAGLYPAGMRGRVPRGSPSPQERLRPCLLACAYSAPQSKAAARAAQCLVSPYSPACTHSDNVHLLPATNSYGSITVTVRCERDSRFLVALAGASRTLHDAAGGEHGDAGDEPAWRRSRSCERCCCPPRAKLRTTQPIELGTAQARPPGRLIALRDARLLPRQLTAA